MIMINTAYIDPSVMTFAIQAIAGAAIAVAAVVVVAWRKAKKKVSDKLGLEEKTKKEVEDEIVVTDEATPEDSDGTDTKEEGEEKAE